LARMGRICRQMPWQGRHARERPDRASHKVPDYFKA